MSQKFLPKTKKLIKIAAKTDQRSIETMRKVRL
jgi:hypothetical protein